MIIFFFLLIVLFVLISAIVLETKKPSHPSETKSFSVNSIDSLNPPASFSPEMRERVRKIADYYGVRYVTGVETHNWILHCLSEDFAAMPGWDIWILLFIKHPDNLNERSVPLWMNKFL